MGLTTNTKQYSELYFGGPLLQSLVIIILADCCSPSHRHGGPPPPQSEFHSIVAGRLFVRPYQQPTDLANLAHLVQMGIQFPFRWRS